MTDNHKQNLKICVTPIHFAHRFVCRKMHRGHWVKEGKGARPKNGAQMKKRGIELGYNPDGMA